MFLNRGEVKRKAAPPDAFELIEQRHVQVRVVLEPIADEMVAGEMRCDLREHRCEASAKLRAAANDVLEVRFEERGMQCAGS